MSCRLLPITGLSSHPAEWRTPRNRPPLARRCASNTGSTWSPRVRSALADNAGRDPGRPVIAGCAHRRDAGDELGLADRAHLGRAVRAVYRTAFEENRRDDAVPGVQIGEQF